MEVENLGAESQISDRIQRIDEVNGADDSKIVAVQVGVVPNGADQARIVGVQLDVVAAGAQVKPELPSGEVVKKKRGRPPRAQPKQPPAKKNKEEDEDVCFICFDGGSLVLCDRRGCPKAYHPACIKRDEAFFRSKAKWNCGWHICSICQKSAHHMCYTCTYSLCKGCIRTADYVCVRGDKGFCTICMRTIMLIENSEPAKDGTAQVDFDDKTSWEYLFKVYWVYLKEKLSLTLDELTQAKNPWKGAHTIAPVGPSPPVHIGSRILKSITSDTSVDNVEVNESKRRKTDDHINLQNKETMSTEKVGTDESLSMVGCKEWATKELLDFVGHMKNGDTSVLSQFDVQALMLDYIKRNNLRDPRKKSQIICDARLKNLFGKPRVGHFEMLKLLEFHFLIKDDSHNNTISRTLRHDDADWNIDNTLMVGKDKKRRNRKKGEERVSQNKVDEYAAIDVHNMNLIYLRRNLMENLIEDSEKFHGKVVGSIVRIRISGSDQKHDMYRLVQVVGTSKVDVPYKLGNKSIDVMLEVLNLDKKETVSIDTISNQEISQEECRRLRQSIRCGLVKRFTVGEIQEKAVDLQSVRLNDVMEAEILRLNHLRDRASEKGHKKSLRECVEKLQILKTPEERERRLREIPEVHSDPKMNPCYESDDAEEYFNNEQEHVKPKFSGVGIKNTSSPQKRAECSNDTGSRSFMKNDKTSSTTNPDMEDGTIKTTGRFTLGGQRNEFDCNGSTVTDWNNHATVSSSLSNIPSETAATSFSMRDIPSADDGEIDKVWHYRDPNGKVQGPFSMVQLQKWSTTGYFPSDMRIWASREADSLLLNDALKQQFHNYDVRWSEGTTATDKLTQRIEGPAVCTAVPASTIPVAPCAPNSFNHELFSDNHGSSSQSSGQNWGANNNLNCNPLGVASLSKSKDPTPQFDFMNMPSPTPKGNHAEIKQPVSSVFTVADAALVELPSPTPKKRSYEDGKVEDAGVKQQSAPPSKLLVQESGNPPSWSSTSSLAVGGSQLPETAVEWGRYSSNPAKREEWDSGRVPMSSLKPLEVVGDHVATPTSNMEQIIHSSSPPPSHLACNNVPSWHGVGETIEFSTLAEESVSDLLAEVDAMESQNGLPSPTSRRNSFVEDLFNGSIEDFSPTPDQGTRSDGFSSSGDIQLPCQSNTTTDEQLVGASQGNNSNIFGLVNTSVGLQPSSISPEIDGETKSTDAVGIPEKTNSENMAFKWPEAERETTSTDARVDRHGSKLQSSPHQLIDINNSTMAEADEGERENETSNDAEVEKVHELKYTQPVVQLESSPNLNVSETSHGREAGDLVQQRQAGVGTKSSKHVPDEQHEEGEYVELVVATAPKPVSPIVLSLKPVSTQSSESTTHRKAGDEITRQSTIRVDDKRGAKLSAGVVAEEEEDGEFHPPQPHLAPPPPPPPFLTMGLEPVDPRKVESETIQGNVNSNSGRSAHGVTNASRFNASTNTNRSGYSSNVGWDPQQRRHGGERHSSNNSPRERSYQVEDSGYSRGGRSSWSRQSSFGSSGGGSGGGGGGYSRPQPKGQRVCKFYESGRCKKGSSCHYLHP